MSMQSLESLVDEKRTVSFYLAPEALKSKGKYVCEIGSSDDEHLLFADSFDELLNKLERKSLKTVIVDK